MKTKLPSTSHRVHRDPVIKTDAELKAGEVKGPSKARGHDADGQKIAPQHDDGYAQSKAPVDRPMADNGHAPVGAALLFKVRLDPGKHCHGPGKGDPVDSGGGVERPTTTNPPLSQGPLGDARMSPHDMPKAIRAGDRRPLHVDDDSLRGFMAGGVDLTHVSSGGGAFVDGRFVAKLGGGNANHAMEAHNLLKQMDGAPDVYAFCARLAELKLGEVGAEGAGELWAHAFVARATEHGITLGSPYGAANNLGRDVRQNPSDIGEWDVESTVRGIARLVASVDGDPSQIDISISPGGPRVPLSEHPFFPGNERELLPKLGQVETGPLGDVARPKTNFNPRDPAMLELSDDGLKDLVFNTYRPELLSHVISAHKDDPRVFKLMARAAELWSAAGGASGGRGGDWRPSLAIRETLARDIPRTELSDDDLEAVVRMAQAANVPEALVHFKGSDGQRHPLTEHPGWPALAEKLGVDSEF